MTVLNYPHFVEGFILGLITSAIIFGIILYKKVKE